jgi:hypothetical protein
LARATHAAALSLTVAGSFVPAYRDDLGRREPCAKLPQIRAPIVCANAHRYYT